MPPLRLLLAAIIGLIGIAIGALWYIGVPAGLPSGIPATGTAVDLSGRGLSQLPAEIRMLRDIEELDISNNRLTGLPAEIGQLSKLRILNASNNQLTGLPHELGNLQQLEVLDLSGNAVSPHDLEIIKARLPASTQIIL